MAVGACRQEPQRTSAPPPQPERPQKPNVVLLVVDTLRWDDSGMSRPASGTPSFFSRFSDSAIVFDNAYSTFDETVGTHFSLLTGFVTGQGTAIDHPDNSLAAQLSRHGYRTIGVAANGNLSPKVMPVVSRFDTYVAMHDVYYGMSEAERIRVDADGDLRLDAYGARHEPFNRFLMFGNAARVTQVLRDSIARERAPFFAFANFIEPHDPYLPDPALYPRHQAEPDGPPPGFDPDVRYRKIGTSVSVSKEKLRAVSGRRWSMSADLTPEQIALYRHRYRAEVREVELQIEKFLQWMSEKGLLRDTIVIITSDHGEEFGETGFMTHALNRQGDREATQHVPLAIQFPSAYRLRGRRIPTFVTSADIAPTIYDYVGIDWKPLALRTDVGNFGKSLVPSIEGALRPSAGAVAAAPVSEELTPAERARREKELKERLRSLGYLR